jgi:hypothetical protein
MRLVVDVLGWTGTCQPRAWSTKYIKGSQGPTKTAHRHAWRGIAKPSKLLETSQRNTVNCEESSPNGAARSIAAIAIPIPDATARAIA